MRQCCIPFFLLVFLSLPAQAQPRLDSLKTIANNNELSAKDRLYAVAKLAEHYQNTHPDSTMYYADLQLRLAKALKNLKAQGLAMWMKSNAYRALNQPEEAYNHLHKGLGLCRQARDSSCIGRILYYLGHYNMNRNYLDSSEYYFRQAWVIGEARNDPRQMITSTSGLGLVARNKGNLEEALTYYQQSLDLMEKSNRRASMGHLYNSMAFIYVEKSEFDKATEYCQRSVDAFEMIGNKKEMAAGLNGLGLIAYYQEDYPGALAHFEKAMALYETVHDPGGVATIFGNQGLVYKAQGNLDKAVEAYTRALLAHRELGNAIEDVNNLINIGSLYSVQEEYRTALRHFQQGLAIFDSIGYQIGKPSIMQQIAYTHLRLGEDSLALKMIREGLALSREIGLKGEEADMLIELGDVYQNNGQYTEAKQSFLQALQIIRETNPNSTGRPLSYLAKLALKQQSWREARDYAEEGLALVKKTNHLGHTNSLAETLWEAQKALGQYKEALETYQLFVQTRDSLSNIDNQRALIRSEYQQKTLTDSLTNAKTLALQVAETKRRTTLSYSLLGGLVVALVLGFLLWNRFRLTRRQKQIIEEEKNKVDQANSDLNVANEKLNVANEQLKEADLSKSRFFTNISHEFRTPLTVILGMTDRLAEEEPRSLIKRNSQQLLKLINQILDLRSLEAGSMLANYQQEDVISYLSYILESFHSYAEEKEISLSFETEMDRLVMDLDQEKLLSVVSNLLSNAVKFTPKGGEVQMTVFQKQENQSNYLVFSVEDTGVGIAPEKLPYIFDRFYQVNEGASQQEEGTGIGLTLVKELIEVLGGEINVLSQVGKGTRFEVKLPISNDAVEASGFPPLGMEQSRPEPLEMVPEASAEEGLPSVLIVEDNADVVRYLISCVQDQYKISVAKDGQEGIEKAIEEVPDLIISDVMMPRKDGFELCQTLKTDERTSHIPIVLLTAKADFDSRLTGLGLGADVYLAKPFDKQELLIQLRNLIAVRKTLQQRYQSGEALQPSDNPITQKQDAFIRKAREVLEQHLDNDQFSVPDFCREMGMSKAQLHRKMKALTNMSTSIFVQNFRLEKAQHLLDTTDLQVAEISDLTGFSSSSYFSNLYKKKYGMPPGKSRAK